MDGTFIGVDLGGTKVAAGRVAADGMLLQSERVQLQHGSFDTMLAQVFSVIDAVRDASVRGIGAGVPGAIDVERGVLLRARNLPEWVQVPLCDLLQQRYDIPAVLGNDAKAFALGEATYGAGKDVRVVAAPTLGTGFGCGIVIDGALYTGAHGTAGEFGHAPLLDKTVEDYCSGKFFLQRGLDGRDASARARKGDADMRALYHEYGDLLGRAFAMIAYAIDPEVIVVGGGIAHDFSLYEEAMRGSFVSRVHGELAERVRIVRSVMPEAALVGASLFARMREQQAAM